MVLIRSESSLELKAASQALELEPESFQFKLTDSSVQSLFEVGGAVGGGIDTQSSRHSSAGPIRIGGAIHLCAAATPLSGPG